MFNCKILSLILQLLLNSICFCLPATAIRCQWVQWNRAAGEQREQRAPRDQHSEEFSGSLEVCPAAAHCEGEGCCHPFMFSALLYSWTLSQNWANPEMSCTSPILVLLSCHIYSIFTNTFLNEQIILKHFFFFWSHSSISLLFLDSSYMLFYMGAFITGYQLQAFSWRDFLCDILVAFHVCTCSMAWTKPLSLSVPVKLLKLPCWQKL